MSFIDIKNLDVEVEGKIILKNFNLTLEKGKIYALMGPNGSGKSTLANVIVGNPHYEVKSGEILFEGKNILDLSVDERAKIGIFMSFQSPVSVSGVEISNFLRQAYNSINEKKISVLDFRKLLKEKAKILDIDDSLFARYLNEGFSGGEKKKSEILQLLILNPKFVILDETDSGLDIDALRTVAAGINSFFNQEKCVLVITHYRRILDYINPDKVVVLMDGQIISEGGVEVVEKLESKGFKGFR